MSEATPLADQVLARLPRTDCGACSEAGCAPYAAAVASGHAALTACTPGGALLTQTLRRVLGEPGEPTLADFLTPLPAPARAVIRDADCIGCTKCIAVCPTDAILGARQQLHGILDADCTGCGLCLPPCPVDCIDIVPREEVPACSSPESRAALAAGPGIEACTDCGACAPACPSGLQPAALARALRGLDTEAARALDLDRCTACGACDGVCPMRIPLTAHFVHGHALLATAADADRRAAHAAERGEARVRRLARSPGAATVTLVTPPPDHADAAAGVQAALARARARQRR